MKASFSPITYNRNQKNIPPIDNVSQLQTFGSSGSGSNENTQCSSENSIQLMIKAHHQIRTLQEDNEILRMHIELLTKDNKDLGSKLQKMQKEKKMCTKSNEDLLRKIKDLEIKLDGYQVKQQLHRIQKQNFTRNQGHKPSQNDYITEKRKENIERLGKNERQSRGSQELQGHNYVGNQFRLKNENKSMLPFYQGSSENKPYNQCQLEITTQNVGQKNQFYKDQRLSKQKPLRNNFSCYLERTYDSLSNSHCKEKANLRSAEISCSKYSSQQRFERSQKNQLNRQQNDYTKHLTSHSQNKPNSIAVQKETEFYISRNTQIRCSSPLIRKNSPVKQNRNECQFHPQSRTGTSWVSNSSNDLGLHKKFKYTNWRKTNNNLMIWRGSNNNEILGKR